MLQQFEEGLSLDRFIAESEHLHPEASGRFSILLHQVSLASRLVSARVNRAGLAGMLGSTGEMNVQGEFVQKLDEYANDAFKRALEHAGCVGAIASEEDDGLYRTPSRFHSGRYIFCMDPLDGSSNIDTNASIGTIFCIMRRRTPEGTPAELSDALQSGNDILAAGYVIYGSGTVLVLGTDRGVNGFTLDPGVGEFFLSHPNIRLDGVGKTFSCNEGYAGDWHPGVRSWLASKKAPGMGWKARYIGSLVADFHRNLIKGGVFLYPPTPARPQGKLRVLYEAFPLAYLAEKAGGAATDGSRRILDLVPDQLHARTPLFIGDKASVDEITAALNP